MAIVHVYHAMLGLQYNNYIIQICSLSRLSQNYIKFKKCLIKYYNFSLVNLFVNSSKIISVNSMDEKSRRQEAYKKYWEVAALEL